ncbi:thioesterase II family protein [Mycolicibacter hiberniae]|uniref:Thioesterase TesA n=1 Tax=Mycolicibacter hiberniae TaxID=29314 RepID=A0A7I7WYK7_9MYCO|nr:alpha/beta fold hydrolase [Mycolicibacter hiberniae]MCV7085566.1 thioesterase [Mycolicibacter hiberniae]ORV71342.1 thioesterase [Mycolicibacter hiberniae]BBZ22574.1 thioesterase [Mycolicibacter hiberniae]
MAVDDVSTQVPAWMGRFPGPGPATLVFPHAGGTAVNYRPLALALAAGADTYVMQYPARADRFRESAAETLPELARSIFDAAPWHRLGPLRLFGHSMGSLVAFEFARIAEDRGIEIQRLWASAAPAPGVVAGLRKVPTGDADLRAELAQLGGTDPRILADEEFLTLLLTPVRADYLAFNRYACPPEATIGADIAVLGGRSDDRVRPDLLERWAQHTTGTCTVSLYDGGHFYHYEHIETLAKRIIADD